MTTPRHRLGATGVVLAFATVLGLTTVPTPLWPLYAQRDGYSSLVVTVVFAAYALGVAVSAYFGGHLSDWRGRRPVLLCGMSFRGRACRRPTD